MFINTDPVCWPLTPSSSLTCCCCCTTDSCPRSRLCCRRPCRRSQRSTSVCPWRTRSCSGSFTTETWVVPAKCRPPPPPPPTPSASSHPVAPPWSPTHPSPPDNNGPCFQEAEPNVELFRREGGAVFVYCRLSNAAAGPRLCRDRRNSSFLQWHEKVKKNKFFFFNAQMHLKRGHRVVCLFTSAPVEYGKVKLRTLTRRHHIFVFWRRLLFPACWCITRAQVHADVTYLPALSQTCRIQSVSWIQGHRKKKKSEVWIQISFAG